MKTVLILNFEAPLMSFGGVLVDQLGRTEDFPGLSLVTGLLANALGWDHADAERLQRLQDRLRIASRCDRAGERLLDYHTVDLGDRAEPHAATNGQPWEVGSARPLMAIGGWTTRGAREDREGGLDARYGTHIRYRHYHADRIQTVAIALEPPEEEPTLEAFRKALEQPARPLFIGRKTCLPSCLILADQVQASSLVEALAQWPRHMRADGGELSAWWPAEEGNGPAMNTVDRPVVDRRDWRNQLVVGRRLVRHGRISPPARSNP